MPDRPELDGPDPELLGRYLAGEWPKANITTGARGNDPCNNYDNTATIYEG